MKTLSSSPDLEVYLVRRASDRLVVLLDAANRANDEGVGIRGVVATEQLAWVTATFEAAGVLRTAISLVSAESLKVEEHPVCESAVRALSELVLEHPQDLLIVDLGSLFDLCVAPHELVSVVTRLRDFAAERHPAVLSFISHDLVPRNLPDLLDSIMLRAVPNRLHGAANADSAATSMAIEATEFRRRVFASSGGESEDPLSTLPGILESFRRGILLMDRHLAVRFCSARAGTLLGWDPGELVGRPISSCIDGVDLVTVRHECEKVASGHARQSPFVASFRISSGVYQAREVSIDAVGTANEIVGYLLGVSAIEQVRGPRAVYRQLKEEKAEPSVDQNHPDDENPVANDLLSSDLHGTRITRREHEIMLLILKGMSNRQIANHLRIAEVTVKKHLTSVYRKLRISNRKELIVSFSRPGSVS